MANEYSPIYFQRDIVSGRPSFGETLEASVGYSLSPILETIGQTAKYGIQREAGYDPFKDMEGYEVYAETLARATNPQHMASIKRTIDDSAKRRQILADSTIGAQLVSGLLDPFNVVALPLGGPTVGALKSIKRVGAGVAAIQAGIEGAVIQPFDPLQTAEESALNITTAALFGGAIGGVMSAPITAKARAHQNTMKAVQEEMDMLRRIENLEGLTREDIASAPPRTERPFGTLSDDDLNTTINAFEESAARTDKEAESYQGYPENVQDFKERAEELRATARAYRNEKAFRELESLEIDLQDPYKIMPSWFTDSIFFKAISTPMKRALQSKYPSAVKEKFVESFSDSGLALALNAMSIPTPQSVAQRAAVSNGKWVASHDKLIRLWASDTSAAQITPLDINLPDLARRAARSENTYRNWLIKVSEKRIQNATDLTENEIKAVNVINDYFNKAQKQLEDVGLIGTNKGVARKIEQLEAEIADLNTRLGSAQLKKTKRGKIESDMLKNRLSLLGERLADERTTKLALEEVKVNPENEDIFFPRFWDAKAIKNNRQEFSGILFNWYQNNPYIYEKNPKTAMFERIKLSTDPNSIQKRVDSTIAKILNEKDPTNVDNIGFGYGRSKHFRHRQIDIPNKLVTKFIVTDPLAVMKTYAARIEPRYEYAKAFGKDVDGVLLDMEAEMIAKGFSIQDINKMRRDYMHMYDRVSGVVIRNPDALNQKAAFILREFASFSYMGSAGLAALPDFGRIVMEYDMDNVVKGIQAIMDKNTVNMTVDEIRIAGEAIDILRGSAHMRMVEDLSNNVDASDLLTSARNAFYILNGLAPMTTIAKQLAGIIDAHTIIDYSIRYKSITPQERTWLARYGIGEEDAKKIASSPWQKSDNNLYMANTEEWTNISLDKIRSEVAKTYKPSGKSVFNMSEAELLKRFSSEFYVDRIITDPKIVDDVFSASGVPNILGRADNTGLQEPATIYLNFKNIRQSYQKLKSRENLDEFKLQLNDALDKGIITEAQHAHQMAYVRNLDVLESEDDFVRFVLLHELHHTTHFQRAGESLADYEVRIDELSFSYLRNEREEGINLAADKEYNAQLTDAEETVLKFRTALNSGVLNTIMSGTPADKPIITDGVAYIPMSVAKKFGMQEDSRVRGYARIENGLMGLPFQFYSYTLANINKTVAALATGQVKNRMIGISTSLGLAYLSLKLRTPDYVWEDMSAQDKFARSFDMSGVMALYSDLFYTSMHTSLALGGPNITGGILAPKFPQEPSALDAATGLAGAGPSWAADVLNGIWQFANGEYAEGGKIIARNAPFARLWFLKDDINQITRAWAQ